MRSGFTASVGAPLLSDQFEWLPHGLAARTPGLPAMIRSA